MLIRSSVGFKRSHGFVALAAVTTAGLLCIFISLGSLNHGEPASRTRGGSEAAGAIKGLFKSAQKVVLQQRDGDHHLQAKQKHAHRKLSRKGPHNNALATLGSEPR